MRRWCFGFAFLLLGVGCLGSFDFSGLPCLTDTDCLGKKCLCADTSCSQKRCNATLTTPEAPIGEPLPEPDPCQPTTPPKEVCDGKDNDCNGQIDDGLPTLLCTGSGPGCTDGKKECIRGRLTCVFEGKFEACFDQADNDCDGKVDEPEECGPSLSTFRLTNPTGSIVKLEAKGFSQKLEVKKTPGDDFTRWRLAPAGETKGCQKGILIMTSTDYPKQHNSYTCDGDAFLLSSSNIIVRPYLKGLNGLQPGTQSGESWARVRVRSSCATQPAAPCQIDLQHGASFSVTRKDIGNYEVTHSACEQLHKPMFATIYHFTADAFVNVRYTSKGRCLVEVRNHKSEPIERDFMLWFPDPQTTLWAAVRDTGEIAASHLPSQVSYAWSANRLGRNTTAHYELSLPLFQKSSVGLLNNLSGLAMTLQNELAQGKSSLYTRAFRTDGSELEEASFLIFVVP